MRAYVRFCDRGSLLQLHSFFLFTIFSLYSWLFLDILGIFCDISLVNFDIVRRLNQMTHIFYNWCMRSIWKQKSSPYIKIFWKLLPILGENTQLLPGVNKILYKRQNGQEEIRFLVKLRKKFEFCNTFFYKIQEGIRISWQERISIFRILFTPDYCKEGLIFCHKDKDNQPNLIFRFWTYWCFTSLCYFEILSAVFFCCISSVLNKSEDYCLYLFWPTSGYFKTFGSFLCLLIHPMLILKEYVYRTKGHNSF